MTDLATVQRPGDQPRGFGNPNPHCTRCGDERGGDLNHKTSECQYRPGISAHDLALTMPPEKRARYWADLINEYLSQEENAMDTKQHRTEQPTSNDHLVAALRRVLAERERELLVLKGPCNVDRCSLHYAHSGPCEIEKPRPLTSASA